MKKGTNLLSKVARLENKSYIYNAKVCKLTKTTNNKNLSKTMFTEKDLQQIAAHGLTPEAVEHQIENFRRGFPFLNVKAAASPDNGGVKKLTESEAAEYAAKFDAARGSKRVVKFVPASGAATRMFKSLFEFVNEGKRGADIDKLIENVDKFAFGKKLRELLPADATDEQTVAAIIKEGLAYGSKPKGLILFHSYGDEARTAIEEHLVEGAQYAACDGKVAIHFTVSPEHIEGFRSLLEGVVAKYEERFGVKYDISFSVQKSSTDTVAVNPDNTPFRNDDGTLLFRPAGHGALIANLDEIAADVIFIKNIDNVTTDARREATVLYKKALAGLLVEVQERAFGALKELREGASAMRTAEIAQMIEEELCTKLPDEWTPELLIELLDRPIRVCGMVRNDGEPGGGPFWVEGKRGECALQIAESSQISPEDAPMMSGATHFNPVDLVCAPARYDGTKFDLTKYTDPATGFISSKSKDGRELRAQELPGLWNGAMADWTTIFVDVPLATFSPVKVVNDLLRPEHQ